jgi:hypothetical protein
MKSILSLLLSFTLGACHYSGRDDKRIDIRIALGYKDARPARFVGDRYERLALIQELVKPCSNQDNQACGFKRSADDGDLMEKTLPKSGGGNLNVSLRITASAVSPDDDANRRNPYQKEMSKLSMLNFLQGLEGSSATLYVGHSRDGGGPDFSPPLMTKIQHVDYLAYKRDKAGLKTLLRTIASSRKKNNDSVVLGIISCASTKLFAKKIKKTAPHLSLLTTPTLLYYADAIKITLRSVSEVISHQALFK